MSASAAVFGAIDTLPGVEDVPVTVSHGTDAAWLNVREVEAELDAIGIACAAGAVVAPERRENDTDPDDRTRSVTAGLMVPATVSEAVAGTVEESVAVIVKEKVPATVAYRQSGRWKAKDLRGACPMS